MDLRQYYKKLHELEDSMTDTHVLVVSEETDDGGKPGVISEVSRRNACKLMLEGRAKLADAKQKQDFRTEEWFHREQFQTAKTASRLQFQMVPIETAKPGPAKSAA